MPQILFTIDTEIGELTKNEKGAFEIFIEGKIGTKKFGYELIMDLLEKYQAKGEFFVDIYPWRKIGEKKFANLCQKIIKRGHKINLHTHPSKMFDSKRTFMHQYSQKEQIEILKLGKKKIKQWTGKYPLAHRARGYGINQDTFKALKKVNIKYDCSYFYQNKNCHLQTEIVNRPFIHHDILEIPVTVFCRKIKYNLLNFNIKYGKKYYQKPHPHTDGEAGE